jgi:hypothetical protein
MIKTKVELTRHDYAIASGKAVIVGIDEPLRVDLELPASYAASLRASLHAAIASDPDGNGLAEISVDVPVKIKVRRLQVEQLIAKLLEKDGHGD